MMLGTLGLFLGGRPAARASTQLGMPTSRTTTLRALRALPLEIPPVSPYVGIDDFALKKGHRYGTIVVDLPTHRVVDLLADREIETVANWMNLHPEVEVVSRDRSSAYAAAVDAGAPQALHVADRFHLLKNVTESLQRVIESKHQLCSTVAKELMSRSEDKIQQDVPEEVDVSSEALQNAETNTQRTTADFQLTQAAQNIAHRRERRLGLYEEVIELRKKGFGLKKIARIVGLSKNTVASWICRGSFPERAPRVTRRKVLDTWAPHIDALHEQGMLKSLAIFRALQQQGYRGSYSIITDYCRRKWKSSGSEQKQASNLLQIPHSWRSPRAITWFFLSDPDRLDEMNKKFMNVLCEKDNDLCCAVKAAQDFASLVRTKGHARLTKWIEATKTTLLRSFAQSIERDMTCVCAAMRERWSQGCVEGNVNRLKVIKRQMYGRGAFDLLRRRVLLKA